MKKYIAVWVGGRRDGETLGVFDDERQAVKFAEKFQEEHEAEFDTCWGGVGIVDGDVNGVEW